MSTSSMARPALLGLALIAAVVPLTFTWSIIVRELSVLLLMEFYAVLVIGIGMAARALRRGTRVTLGIQVAALVGVSLLFSLTAGGVLRLPSLVASGAAHLRGSIAPIAPTAGSTLVLCLIVGVLALITDLLAIGLERPTLTLAPLLLLLMVPSISLKDHPPPLSALPWFAWGVAVIWFTAQRATAPGRSRATATAVSVWTATVTLCLSLIVAYAIAPRAVVGTEIPVDASIQMNDISLDLKRSIRQGANTPALDYVSDDSTPQYLRLYSLPTFNAGGWHLTNSNVQTGALPTPPGQVRPGPIQRVDVTITGFRSEWLPAPYAPVRTTATGSWGFLPESLSILAVGGASRAAATEGLSYTVESRAARPSTDEILAAPAARPPDADITASVPSDVSPELVQLARDITQDETTPGGKTLAILRYLQQPKFLYSLDAQPGSGYPGLEDFLLRDHKGFCVQYAASMAILARIAGVPTRVAIGFAPGKRVDDHFTVTMHDMHAWPEVYLGGYGWVAFEPTPGGPDGFGSGGEVAPSASPSAGPTRAPSTSSTPSASSSSTPTSEAAVPDGPTPTTSNPWPAVLGVGGLALIVLAAAPWWLRERRRRTRLAGVAAPDVRALDAWAEVRGTAWDYGRTMPAGSPAIAVEGLTSWLDSERGSADLRDLARAAERAQFGGPDYPAADADWRPAVDAFRSALVRLTPSRWARLRVTLLPPSLFSSPPPATIAYAPEPPEGTP